MIVHGFDLSLRATGFAVGVDGKITEHGLIQPGILSGLDRIRYIRDAVVGRIRDGNPALVMFEDFSFASKGSALHEIIGMSFAIRLRLHESGITWATISPTGLKKLIVGRGGSAKNPCPKELVIKYLATKWGHDVDDNNACDAIGVTYAGMASVGDWLTTNDAQRDVLKTVGKAYPFLQTMGKNI